MQGSIAKVPFFVKQFCLCFCQKSLLCQLIDSLQKGWGINFLFNADCFYNRPQSTASERADVCIESFDRLPVHLPNAIWDQTFSLVVRGILDTDRCCTAPTQLARRVGVNLEVLLIHLGAVGLSCSV